jgi:hypothetical protein
MIPNDFSIVAAEGLVRDTVIVPRGGFLRIQDGTGATVHVHQGLVWLTQHQDRKDRFLEAGDQFVLDRDGKTIAQAFSEASITLLTPATSLALRFDVLPAALPPAPDARRREGADAAPAAAGTSGFVAFAGAVLSAAQVTLSRGWFALTRLVWPKPEAQGGRHG